MRIWGSCCAGRGARILICLALLLTPAEVRADSDESELYDFIDKHLLLLSRDTIERGVGAEREAAPCRHYFQALNIAECCCLPNLDFARDGRTFFAATKDGEVIAVDLRDGVATTLVKFDELGAIKLSNDGQSLGVVTKAGIVVIRLTDQSVTPIFAWPNRLNAEDMQLSETRLAWNAASNQILVHGSMNGLWHYDLSKQASTEIENAAAAFFHDGRVYVIRRESEFLQDARMREILDDRVNATHRENDDVHNDRMYVFVERLKDSLSRSIIFGLDERFQAGAPSHFLPSSLNTHEYYEIQPIAGSPYLSCQLSREFNKYGVANCYNYVLDPCSRWHVLASHMDIAMPACVEDSRETLRLLAKQGVFAEGKGLRVARLTATYDRHSGDGKFPWTWSVDVTGFVTLRGPVNLKQETYQLDFKGQKALRALIERIDFCALPAKIGSSVPDTGSRSLEVTFDDGRMCRTILFPLDALEASDASGAGRFLELWTMIRGTFSSDWAFDDRAEIERWKRKVEGERKGAGE